ncbi:hypothetical protein EDB85DRAFT_1894111 [Lactarius pseudohatsudake]|nr:hypothetical protein EDB85DRAFT_1894111 [Lactarius pseudohatsudake]
MFTSRGQLSLSTLVFLLHHSLFTHDPLTSTGFPAPPLGCRPHKNTVNVFPYSWHSPVSSITLALVSTLVAGDGCGIVGEQGKLSFPLLYVRPVLKSAQIFTSQPYASPRQWPQLLVDTNDSRKATPMTTARQHRQLQVDTNSGDKDISDDSKAASMTTATGDVMERQRGGCSLAKTKWNTSQQLEDSKLGWVDMRTGSRSQAHGAREQVPVTVGPGSGSGSGLGVSEPRTGPGSSSGFRKKGLRTGPHQTAATLATAKGRGGQAGGHMPPFHVHSGADGKWRDQGQQASCACTQMGGQGVPLLMLLPFVRKLRWGCNGGGSGPMWSPSCLHVNEGGGGANEGCLPPPPPFAQTGTGQGAKGRGRGGSPEREEGGNGGPPFPSPCPLCVKTRVGAKRPLPIPMQMEVGKGGQSSFVYPVQQE